MRNLDILAAENGEHIRVLLCGEEQCYVVSCQHFRMPYPVASDLLAELQPVPAETYSVFVLDEDITNRQREGCNRKLDLIAPLLVDTCIPSIMGKSSTATKSRTWLCRPRTMRPLKH